MANTYTQIHVQLVFAVKFRNAVISEDWEDRLFMYITGIVQQNGHKVIIINGMPDHVHLLVGLRPNQSLSDLLQDVKGSSSKWINNQKLTRQKFPSQEGYGAFSYSKSQLPAVVNYIKNQKVHHKKTSFQDEYMEFLKMNRIDFDEKYLFVDPQ